MARTVSAETRAKIRQTNLETAAKRHRALEENELLRDQLEAAHRAQREAEAETGRALAAHAIEAAQLRGNPSLAEEGLANYAQENEQLRKAIRAAHSRVQGYRGGCACTCVYCVESQSAEHGDKHE